MTNLEAARILRTENIGDSEEMAIAKQMGADALDTTTPKCCRDCVKTVPERCVNYTTCPMWRDWFQDAWELIQFNAGKIKRKKEAEEGQAHDQGVSEKLPRE